MVQLQSFLLTSLLSASTVAAFAPYHPQSALAQRQTQQQQQQQPTLLFSSAEAETDAVKKEDPPVDYEVPEDAVVTIKPMAMNRLRELRDKQDDSQSLILRMGVRSGGCSGMSYVMDFSTEDAIEDDDEVDEYSQENIKCVVDAKSMLYLYGVSTVVAGACGGTSGCMVVLLS